jgi:hypothetical protein
MSIDKSDKLGKLNAPDRKDNERENWEDTLQLPE